MSKFLDTHGIEPREVVSASKKLGKKEAKDLIESASKVIVAKGKNVREFPGGKATKEAVEAMLGPTGNLRSPTVRAGKTILVGFDEDRFEQVLGT